MHGLQLCQSGGDYLLCGLGCLGVLEGEGGGWVQMVIKVVFNKIGVKVDC